ncbi:MAG: glycosyltransferase family 4 protein [Candidatus Kariarchaeaceae archaeon]
MTARANTRSVRSLMRRRQPHEPLNILTFATHERYEENLCKTGHNFYSLRFGKEWDTTYAPVPDNYHIVDKIPEHVDIDLVLSHTSCNRIQAAHDLLTGTRGGYGQLPVPILRHCHVLPDIRFNTKQEISSFGEIPVDTNSFISNFNRDAWGFSEDNANVVEHGVDTEFWGEPSSYGKMPFVLSVVNEFPSRDWCCGFEIWKAVASSVPCKVVGKCTGKDAGFSQPAESREQLREIYQTATVFLNTSIHSPVPTVMMEAMACGCPVVTTGTCMIPEIIEHGVNGIIAKDVKDMKFWCRELLEKPELANKIGEAGRKTIREKYNLERFVRNWDKLLYKTIGEFTC